MCSYSRVAGSQKSIPICKGMLYCEMKPYDCWHTQEDAICIGFAALGPYRIVRHNGRVSQDQRFQS